MSIVADDQPLPRRDGIQKNVLISKPVTGLN
jgi:hypothetical protein